jgi:hypothetical protein
VSAHDTASTAARRQIRGPVEFPKWVKVDGKPELALNAEHEADIRNRAGVIDPASCEPRLPGAEGDQIPAPIEPQDVAKALGIAWQGDKTLEKIKPEWKGVRQLRTPSSEKGVGGGDRAVAREGESPADSAQLVRTPLERIGSPAIAADAKPHVLIPFDLDEAVTVAQAAQIAGRTAVPFASGRQSTTLAAPSVAVGWSRASRSRCTWTATERPLRPISPATAKARL